MGDNRRFVGNYCRFVLQQLLCFTQWVEKEVYTRLSGWGHVKEACTGWDIPQS